MKTKIRMTLDVVLDNGKQTPVTNDEIQDFVCETECSFSRAQSISAPKSEIVGYRPMA